MGRLLKRVWDASGGVSHWWDRIKVLCRIIMIGGGVLVLVGGLLIHRFGRLGAVFIIVGLLIVVLGVAEPVSNRPQDPLAEQPHVDDKLTPELLVSHFGSRTDMQAAALVERHRGEWMRATGPMTNVRPGGSATATAMVRMQRRAVTLVMFFDDEPTARRLSALNRGDEITVVGKVHEVRRREVVLYECRLEKP
jgi:hypothetical protein